MMNMNLLSVVTPPSIYHITSYCPTVSARAGGAYSQKLEAVTIMKIKNDTRTQFWIDFNTEISN